MTTSKPTLLSEVSRAHLIILVVVAALFLLPIKILCGASGKTCTTAPDAEGRVTRFYVWEPLGIKIIEDVLNTDIEIHYWQAEDTQYMPNPGF